MSTTHIRNVEEIFLLYSCYKLYSCSQMPPPSLEAKMLEKLQFGVNQQVSSIEQEIDAAADVGYNLRA